jgi:hypothetical protein
MYDMLRLSKLRIPSVGTTIEGVKARLPRTQFIGGVTASAFNPGGYWPNGTRVSEEQMKQILWIVPNAAFALRERREGRKKRTLGRLTKTDTRSEARKLA